MKKWAKKRPRLPEEDDPKFPIIPSSDNDDGSSKIAEKAMRRASGNPSSSATDVKEKINKTIGRTEAQVHGLENVEKKEDDGATKESDATIETAPLEKSNNVDLQKLPEKDCFTRKKRGHNAKDCPENSSSGFQTAKICLNCGNLGHEMFSCKIKYSLDDLKEIQCYVCKSFGHLCCANYVREGSREVSCYRCGQLGHSGLDCARVHAETKSKWTPSSCFICGEEAHMACKCTTIPKKQKRKMEFPISRKKKSSRRKRKKTHPNLSQPKPTGMVRYSKTPAMVITNNGYFGGNSHQSSNGGLYGVNGYQSTNDRFHNGNGYQTTDVILHGILSHLSSNARFNGVNGYQPSNDNRFHGINSYQSSNVRSNGVNGYQTPNVISHVVNGYQSSYQSSNDRFHGGANGVNGYQPSNDNRFQGVNGYQSSNDNRFQGVNGYQSSNDNRFHGVDGYQCSNDNRFHGGGGYNLGYSNPGFNGNQGNFQYESGVGFNGNQHTFPASRFGNSSNHGNINSGWGY